MFERTKDRIEKFDESNETFHKIHQHVEKHKIAYIAAVSGLGCLVVGSIGGAAIGKVDTKQTVDSLKLVHIQYKSPNVNIALVKRACPDPIPVLDKMTGERYGSIRRAAAVTGTNAREIAKDIHGAQEVFKRLPDSVFA